MKTYRPLLVALAIVAVLVVVVLLARRGGGPAATPEQATATPAPTPVPLEMVLFYPGDDDLLHRETRQVAQLSSATGDCVRRALEEMLAGSRDGWATPFPWPATVETVFVGDGGTTYVDFSSPPAGAVQGASGELALTYATVNTVVANCPGASRVQLLFGGHEVRTLGHLDLSRPLAPRTDLVAQ